MASYTKLRDGSWGVRVQQAAAPTSGVTITVTTKAGAVKTETIGRVLWSGNGVHICTVSSTRSSSRGGKWTGCSCGSREDDAGDLIPSSRNCKQCDFDAYDC